MIEAIKISSEQSLNHDFNGVIDGLIEKVAEGELNHEAAFRHGWRAAFAKNVDSDERRVGLDTLLNSFPKEIQMELSRPLSPEGKNTLMIIAAQEEIKAVKEGRLPKSQRIYLRRQTARMRGKLNL